MAKLLPVMGLVRGRPVSHELTREILLKGRVCSIRFTLQTLHCK